MINNINSRPIYVLQGEGVAEELHNLTCEMFKKHTNNPVQSVDYSYFFGSLTGAGTFVFPGGNGCTQFSKIDNIIPNTKLCGNLLRQIASNGTNIIGICAGAYLAKCAQLTNSGYKLCSASLDNQKIRLRDIHWNSELFTAAYDKNIPMLYWGGPEFIPDQSDTILASFAEDNKYAAIIETTLAEKSKGLFFSTHPEIDLSFSLHENISYIHSSCSIDDISKKLATFQPVNDRLTRLCLSRLNLNIKPDEILRTYMI